MAIHHPEGRPCEARTGQENPGGIPGSGLPKSRRVQSPGDSSVTHHPYRATQSAGFSVTCNTWSAWSAYTNTLGPVLSATPPCPGALPWTAVSMWDTPELKDVLGLGQGPLRHLARANPRPMSRSPQGPLPCCPQISSRWGYCPGVNPHLEPPLWPLRSELLVPFWGSAPQPCPSPTFTLSP